MNKYWILPVVAIAAIAASKFYSNTTIEKNTSADAKAALIDGTKISQVKFESFGAEDKHNVAVLTINPGTENGLTFAIQLNDLNQKVITNVGDFPAEKYCKGEKVLECSIPIPKEVFDRSMTIGIATYAMNGQLIKVKSGRADRDGNRSLFPTFAYHGAY
ncbi:hypothetical protein [Pseudomonas lactucae]|uniref:Uncharacterized protein n=1 Tax=Pseudomonas lactucae TaxID=2813360 RepID=A0A9X0Y7C3_9PSED|nr:hypothetical protein [Pseudomonas lactucae]MBN2974697.1 hypothetical protein [Pseudomonas lactucae]MBN2987318.1 hypothetical protein [Pseudomonas lactucae]